MNISPNTNGLIDKGTIDRLAEFKTWVDQIYNNDLTRSESVRVSASTYRGKDDTYAPQMAIDGNYDTYFAIDDAIRSAVIEIDLGSVQEIKGFIIQEYIPLGQRVDGYTIECRVNGNWKKVFSGKHIGYKRIILEGKASASDVKFPASDGVRLRIEDAMACPLISTFNIIGEPGISNNRNL